MIKFTVDMEALGEVAGTLEGLNEGFDSRTYLDSIVSAAHDEASKEFDLTAAATAGAGRLSHMYEFGVQGITRGQARLADPTSPAARLWVHNLTGSNGRYDANFTFRPAVQPNPRPTTRDTGVPSKYVKFISRRKYIFRNKAIVMETGQEVTIRPKRGNLLFVPFYGDPGPRGRGYMMWNADTNGPLMTNPGRNSAGTFTSFWESWWTTGGIKSMNNYIANAVSADTKQAFVAAEARAAKIVPVPASYSTAQVMSTRKKAKSTTSAMVQRNGIARRGTKRR